MRSPFPGMDPYLEDRGRWPDFHTTFLVGAREQLLDRLPPNYDARIEEGFQLIEDAGNSDPPGSRRVEADVAILRVPHTETPRAAAAPGAALLEPVIVPLPAAVVEVRSRWIEVRDLADGSLVTVIELLSPSNKLGQGADQYAARRRSLIEQDVNLVELDLLLRGRRLRMDARLPPGDCYAFVARAGRRPDCEVYAWSIRRPLPTLPIPLRAPDPDISFDLAAVFAVAFERGRYPRRLHYDRPLDPACPLSDDDRAWVEGLARSAVG